MQDVIVRSIKSRADLYSVIVRMRNMGYDVDTGIDQIWQDYLEEYNVIWVRMRKSGDFGHGRKKHYFDNSEYAEYRMQNCREFLNEKVGGKQENKTNQTMQKLTPWLKRALDSGLKTLYKAGYINGDLELTSQGEEALKVIAFDANKEELIASAQTVIDEAEAEKKNNA